MREWEEKNNKKTVSFLKKLIASILKSRFQVTNFGWWPTGLRGRYSLTVSWNNLDEIEE
jgi:hypothetical protein